MITENRIETTFASLKNQGKAALITYIMAYDPNYETSLEIMKNLPVYGADIIELGIPFSDPMADGPAIQEAANRALLAGASVKNIFSMMKKFRKENLSTPVILMGYYNPIYSYGIKNFIFDAKDSGADGVIIVDLPPEEEEEFTNYSIPADFSLIKLTTPTTSKNRAKIILKNSSGFIYYVSVVGITGVKSANTFDIETAIKNLKKQTKLPIAVGFGIKTPEQAASISKIADGVVIGSAFVNLIKENGTKTENVFKFVQKMSNAIKG